MCSVILYTDKTQNELFTKFLQYSLFMAFTLAACNTRYIEMLILLIPSNHLKQGLPLKVYLHTQVGLDLEHLH